MRWARIGIVAGLLAFAAQTAEAAAPPRTMDLEILANGRLLLRGELIDGIDDLEARLRIMRDNEPPFELRLKLPKTFNIDIVSIIKTLKDMSATLGLLRSEPNPQPTEIDSSI